MTNLLNVRNRDAEEEEEKEIEERNNERKVGRE